MWTALFLSIRITCRMAKEFARTSLGEPQKLSFDGEVVVSRDGAAPGLGAAFRGLGPAEFAFDAVSDGAVDAVKKLGEPRSRRILGIRG